MGDTVDELNTIELSQADNLAGKKNYSQALKLYGDILKRSRSQLQQSLILERIDNIKAQLAQPKKAPATGPARKQEQDKESSAEFKVYENRFRDVIGMIKEKKLLFKQISLPIKKMDMFHKLNLKPMTGIIVYGPAGIGKTALLKAISGELQIPMAYISLRDIRDKYVGGSEKNINKYFELARKKQPCILFFDEIDALGGARDDIDSQGAGTEKKDTVTQFLTEISKLHEERDAKVSLVGATNMPWAIDKALVRSGRLEFMLYIKPPSFTDRKRLFKYYLNVNLEYVGHIDWNLLALASSDYSGADIEKVCKQVKLEIIDKGKGLVTTRAIQNILKSKELGKSSLDEFYINAYHNYIKRPKYKKIGKDKQLIEQGGKFDKGDLEIYKDFVNDVKRFMWYKNSIKLMRFLARGF